MTQQRTYQLVALVMLAVLLVGLGVSGCNASTLFEGWGAAAPPSESVIYAPAAQTKVIMGSPVQIQSGHAGKDIVRVELYVNNQFQRADTPQNGRVTQEWIPAAPGDYLINVKAFDTNNAQLSDLTTSLHVRDALVIAPAPPTPVVAQAEAAPAAARFADELTPPQQNSCEFNTEAAPQLNLFEVGGVGDIRATEAKTAIALPAEAGPNLVVTWNAAMPPIITSM